MKYLKFYLVVSTFLSIYIMPGFAQDKSVYIEGYDQLRYSVEEISVNAGATVEITLKTVSTLPKSQMAHNWVLLKKNSNVEKFVNQSVEHKANDYIDPELTDQIIAYTGMLGGGAQESITFTAPQTPGDYIYVCTFPGHYMAGMKGRLIVK